jgi:hypothetical protein
MATNKFSDDFSDDRDISLEGLLLSPSLLNHEQHTNFFDIDSLNRFLDSLEQSNLDMAYGLKSGPAMPADLAFPMQLHDMMEDGASGSYVALHLIVFRVVD